LFKISPAKQKSRSGFGRSLQQNACKEFVPFLPVHGFMVPMNVQVAVLCDAATDNNGKLNLLGAFDAILAPQLPAIHVQCSIALRITFTNGEDGAHQMRISFVDADGRSIMPGIDLPFRVDLPGDIHFATLNFIVGIQQLKFDKPGVYSIDVAVDGNQETSIPLMVNLLPART